MLPFRKILFPVDYSEPCNAVVPYVKDMVRQFEADLTLVHAYGLGALMTLAEGELAFIDPGLSEKVQASEEGRLRQYAQETFPGQHVETIVEVGEPAGILDRVAQHQGADLVMLATHGHGPMRRLLLGSVTTKVLHDLSAAVWTGVGSALSGHAPGIPYQSIVCALDESDEAEVVLKAAHALACAYHAQLSLLHVVQPPIPSPEYDFGPVLKELTEAAHFRLREMKAKLGVDAPHTVVDAVISDGVRQEVLRRKADLVVTGRGHAQRTLSRIWSHLYSIVRESPCPVLSI
ncbi:MAG TPA: universal stress protein [Bryobacteraceae bacterium]|nr:universal stress protein [Bryobacteraceae bacterium]